MLFDWGRSELYTTSINGEGIMSTLPVLAPAPGIFPAIDMPMGRALVTISNLQGFGEEITALKVGSEVVEEHGFVTMASLCNDIGNKLPICYDRQKGASDTPFMVERQVKLAAGYGISSYIGNPLGAGSSSIEDKLGTLEAFVASAKKFGVTPIVVLEMTQPGALTFSSQKQAEDLAQRAYALGVRYFVAPATKPDRIAAFRRIIGNDSEIISPGVGPQKSGDALEDAKAAIMAGADHIVVGRAIYDSPDPAAMVQKLYGAIREAHLKRKFIEFIVDSDVVGFFEKPITLKAGGISHWYANWRTVGGDVYLTDKLADFLLDFIEVKGIEYDVIYGVPEGATKLATIAQYKWAQRQDGFGPGSHVLLMGRGAAKGHGLAKDKRYLGEPKGRAVVIEDVTTTASSVISAVQALQEDGVDVVAVVSLTNRLMRREDGKSAAEAVAELNAPFYSMSTAAELLPRVADKIQPGAKVRDYINREFKESGTVRMEL